MDPIFDRLGRLIRSFGVDTSGHPAPRSSDPDLQEAEDELEEFLRTGKEAPKKPAGQGNRTFQEQRRQESSRQAPPRPGLEATVAQAFAILGVSQESTWDQINASHRSLLKKHHPDRHAGNEALMKQATAESQKINEAYQVLKKHLGR